VDALATNALIEMNSNKIDDLAALKEEMSATAIFTLLRRGEILTITEGEMATDVWAESLANPPLVYYEGTPHPIDELESIVAQIVTRLQAGDITVSWKEDPYSGSHLDELR
jgi:hypothetical protein